MFRVLVIAAAILASCLGRDLNDVALESALHNPRELGNMFDSFSQTYGRHYSRVERGGRMKVFEQHLQEIHDHNHQDTTWREAVNKFADMTESERAGYLGVNLTNVDQMERVKRDVNVATPDSVSWIEAGGVTVVKNQGSCGSCWIFSALGSLEGTYQQSTGVLRNIAEQEVLDCDVDSPGCSGGLMWNAIAYIQGKGGIASTANYPYLGEWNGCHLDRGNAIPATQITGYVHVEAGEEHTIAAMAGRPLVVTIYVSNSFFSYSSGIYRDETRASRGNHALVGVAYTPEYVLVKNSWGSEWGEQGFVKVARNYDGCAFHMDVGYATVEVIGADDNDSDEATDYNPDDGDDGDDGDACVDKFSACTKHLCNKYTLISQNCEKTCHACQDCPAGTIKCDDGFCRHEHMC